MVGGISTKVEVLLDRGPSPGVVEDLPEERQFPAVATIGDKGASINYANKMLIRELGIKILRREVLLHTVCGTEIDTDPKLCFY